MSAPAVKLPDAIVTLRDEHRYMRLLLDTLDEQLETSRLSKAADYFLIQDIVRYLHEYPDAVHHPTEDLLFDKLVHRRPDAKKPVARLRRDHAMLSENTAGILQLLDNAADGSTPEAAVAVRAAIEQYVHRLRQHMRFEETELFPSAVRCLAHKDWQTIESSLSAVQDPLFGPRVARDYRVLYEFFSNRASELSRRAAGFGFLQLDSMIVSADAIESGAREMLEMLVRHSDALLQELRNTRDKSVAGGGAVAILSAQIAFMAFAGRKGFDVTCDATGISFRTFRNAIQPLWKGAA